MVLLVCPECSNQVSSTAAACPKCGAPPPINQDKLPDTDKKKKPLFTTFRVLLAILFWIVVVGALRSCSDDSYPTSYSQTTRNPITETTPKIETWSYSEYTDKITNKLVKVATLKSSNYHTFDFPYNGRTYATITIRSHPKYGKDIILEMDQGQFVCSVYSDCSVDIRFDEGAPFNVSAGEPSDNSSNVLFLRGYEKLLRKIKASKKMYISTTVYQNGSPVYEFNTEDLKF